MSEPKKTQTTSSEEVPEKKKKRRSKKGIRIRGVKKKFKVSFRGEEPRFEFHPKPKDGDVEEQEAPKDDASNLKYPPPRNHPRFRTVWSQFIESISGRENFKIGHLNNLEILCDLYVEYDDLKEFLRKKGRSYLSIGRQGEVWKFYPEVAQLNRVSAQIKDYTKILGLNPKADHAPESGGEKDEWD